MAWLEADRFILPTSSPVPFIGHLPWGFLVVVSCVLVVVSCFLVVVSCFLVAVSCFLVVVSCILVVVSCFLIDVSCFVDVSCFLVVVSPLNLGALAFQLIFSPLTCLGW